MARIMPAALDVNWEAVKMLAMEVGVREAARRMEIPEGAVMMRSSRERWLADMPRSAPLPASMVRAVSSVSTPSKILAQAMHEDSLDCRATALRVAKRALKRVERSDDDELMVPEVAEVLNKHTKTASVAGSWNAQVAMPRVNLTVTGNASPLTLEAELVQDAETPASTDLADY